MHQLLDLLGKPLLLLDERGTVRFANRAATLCFESQNEALTEGGLHEAFPSSLASELHHHIPHLVATGASRCWRYSHSARHYEVCISPLEDLDDPAVALALISHDITDQELLADELSRTRRALEMLNRCNGIMIHAHSEAAMLSEVCHAIVEVGGYSLAWIGFAEPGDAQCIRPVAHAGFNHGYLEQVTVSWGDNEFGRGPVGQAVRECRPAVVDDIGEAREFRPWCEQAQLRGYQSVVALPLCTDVTSHALGALTIYAPERNAFDAEETARLKELADNLSHGIRALRQAGQLRKLSQAVEQSPVAVMITDRGGHIDYVNPCFERVTGYSADEVRGHNPRFLKTGHTPAAIYAELWQAIQAGQTWQGELQNRSKKGRLLVEHVTISPMLDSQGEVSHYLAIMEDITERKAFEERLWQQTNFDPLTKLPNRALLLDRLDQAMAGAHREEGQLALLLIDLDNFKTINDSLGHETGDEFLLDVARRLQSLMHEGETLGRIGGDEFAMVLAHGGSLYELESSAEAIRRALQPALCIEGKELFVSASIGIALYPRDGISSGMLLKNADAAMYRAKQGGRNTYRFFTPELNRELEQRLEMESHLRRALPRGELQVYFQPQFDCNEGALTGAEALLRWLSPELGYIQPDHFIPLAEETGLILEIGQWVLEQSCLEARRWHDAGYPQLHISVNLSLRQFQQRDLVAVVKQALLHSGLPPHALELELTESTLMKDIDQVAATLRELKKLGVRLALDDFGTGYSSLSYLKRFPFDVLKIDRAFVSEVITNADDAALCEAIIAMGQRLKLQVIAEGVETEEQYIYLCSRGCDLLQGYYFGKAMPDTQFRAQLASLIP